MNVRPWTQLSAGKWLVRLRKTANISQARIAGDAEIDVRNLRRWEKKAPRQIVDFLRLLDAAGATIVLPGVSPQQIDRPSEDDDLLDQALDEIAAVLRRLVNPESTQAPQRAVATSRRKR